MRVLKTVRNAKPLYFKGEWLYCSRNNGIVRTKNLGEDFEFVGAVRHSSTIKNLLAKCSALARRVLRLDIFRAVVSDCENVVFLSKGGVHLIEKGSKESRLVLPLKGRPLSICYKKGDCILVGEYHANTTLDKMSVYKSEDEGLTWTTAYSFDAGTILHIHGIAYDEFDDVFWISTGDHNSQVRLVKASTDFSKVEVVLQGGQANRFLDMRITQKYLITTNDAPNADNYICCLDKASGELKRLQRINNSSFFLALKKNKFFCSTNCEYPESLEPKTFSEANDFKKSHIWELDLDSLKAREVGAYKSDIFSRMATLGIISPYTFQFSNMFFAEGDSYDDNLLVCYANGISGLNGSFIVFQI